MKARSENSVSLWAPLIIAVATALVAWDVIRDWAEVKDQAEQQLNAMARVVESRASQVFFSIDGLLTEVADELDAQQPKPGDAAFHKFMQARSKGYATALTVTVVSLDGTILHSTQAQLVGKNVGNRSYLTHFQQQPDDNQLYVGEPTAALLGRKVVFTARMARAADGTPKALVVSALPPAIFTSILDATVPDMETAAVSISNRSHIIVARAPDPGGQALGKSLAESPLMQAHIKGGMDTSLLVGPGGVDNAERMIAIRNVAPIGLVIGVSATIAEIHARIWRDAIGGGFSLLIVAAVTIAMARVVAGRDRARAKVESEIVAARDHYVRILENFPVLVWRSDLDGNNVAANRTWRDFTGSPGTIPDWSRDIHPDDLALVLKARAAILDGGAECEYRLAHFCGSHRWVREIARPLPGRHDDVAGILGVCVDIHDEKASKTLLERSNEELEQFAYVTSHDLREPLRMVSAYLTLIERRLGDAADADLRDFMAFARDGANRMDHLILDLLDLSRIGRMSSPPTLVALSDILSVAMTQLTVALADSGAVICVGDLPELVSSETDMVRLFQNLIANAVKYARPDVPPRIAIDAIRKGDLWEFSVTDNGIGIDPQYHDRIFRIFQRLHGRESHGGGSGIGLAVCRKIVEGHNGRIWVETPPDGIGSAFHFTLPV